MPSPLWAIRVLRRAQARRVHWGVLGTLAAHAWLCVCMRPSRANLPRGHTSLLALQPHCRARTTPLLAQGLKYDASSYTGQMSLVYRTPPPVQLLAFGNIVEVLTALTHANPNQWCTRLYPQKWGASLIDEGDSACVDRCPKNVASLSGKMIPSQPCENSPSGSRHHEKLKIQQETKIYDMGPKYASQSPATPPNIHEYRLPAPPIIIKRCPMFIDVDRAGSPPVRKAAHRQMFYRVRIGRVPTTPCKRFSLQRIPTTTVKHTSQPTTSWLPDIANDVDSRRQPAEPATG
ncbi:hypothetical protein BD779DRAFT_1475335 [Infundibulicybe gibba]|nr:hypothetical protein BD779DRAFT_1475335 [Infundibulicybe gibba]